MAEKKITLKIKGMRCMGCVETVKGALSKIEGVHQVDVDLESGTAVVVFDTEKTSVDVLINEIQKLGYKAYS